MEFPFAVVITQYDLDDGRETIQAIIPCKKMREGEYLFDKWVEKFDPEFINNGYDNGFNYIYTVIQLTFEHQL